MKAKKKPIEVLSPEVRLLVMAKQAGCAAHIEWTVVGRQSDRNHGCLRGVQAAMQCAVLGCARLSLAN